MVATFAAEWSKLLNLEDYRNEMKEDSKSSKAFQMTDTYINEYFREPGEPITSGDLQEQEYCDFQEALIETAENDLRREAVLRKLPHFDVNLVNLDMKLHRYVKTVEHNLSMMFNGLVANNEISKVFTYEWKRPFNDDSGKKATSGVTCPCCKNTLTLDLKAKPNENQEMKLLVEVKAELEEEPETRPEQGGLTREMLGYSKEESLLMERCWDENETGAHRLGELAEDESDLPGKLAEEKKAKTSVQALNLDAPKST